jgi:hypothetical protein
MKRRLLNKAFLMLPLLVWQSVATAWASDASKMERLLDEVDRPGSWPSVNSNQVGPASATAASQGAANTSRQSTLNQGVPQSPFTPQNILRVMLGAPPKGTATGSTAGARGNLEENLQTARDQASRAESACGRASSGSDKEARLSAAEEARYAAQAAREASDRAYGQSQNTTSDLADLAAQANAAADRAQAAADRATANAEGGGW